MLTVFARYMGKVIWENIQILLYIHTYTCGLYNHIIGKSQHQRFVKKFHLCELKQLQLVCVCVCVWVWVGGCGFEQIIFLFSKMCEIRSELGCKSISVVPSFFSYFDVTQFITVIYIYKVPITGMR